MQQKVRINDLARELEVKSKVILDLLIKVGVTEKKTHSSSIEVDEAERVKKYYAEHGEPGSSPSSRASRAATDEFKPKIDLSHISKPGDVLKAITQKAAQPADTSAPHRRRDGNAAAHQCYATFGRAAASAEHRCQAAGHGCQRRPAAPVEPPKPAPRFVTPQSVARPPATVTFPPPKAPVAPPVAEKPAAAPVTEAPKPVEVAAAVTPTSRLKPRRSQ